MATALPAAMLPVIERPSDLPNLPPYVEISLDTEGSGLHVDDGARVSTVTMAWFIPGKPDWVQTAAFPFNQGLTQHKREWTGQASLWEQEGPFCLPRSEWDALWVWLDRRKLVMANATFDSTVMEVGVDRPGWSGSFDLFDQVVWDVIIANKEIWPTYSPALKEAAVRLRALDPANWRTTPDLVQVRGGYKAGMEKDDEERLKRDLAALSKRKLPKRYDLVEWDLMRGYATLDAELTARERVLQARKLAEWRDHCEEDRRKVEGWIRREFRKARVLHLMERRGMPFDAQKCLEGAAQIHAYKSEVAARLPFGFRPGQPGNDLNLNHAKRYWFDPAGNPGGNGPRLEPLDTTETGKPKLDAEIARKMAKRKIPHAADYFLWKQLDDALSKWYEAYPGMVGSDGRLRQSFNQTSVRSGRTSVSRVNLQAIPNDYQLTDRLPSGCPTIHNCIVATPGHSLYSIDLAQAELRVAARWAPCPRMLDLVTSGADAHGITATSLFGVTPDSPEWKMMRNVAKRGNFSLIFDVGAKTFQASLSKIGIEWPLAKIEPMVSKWKYELYPEFRHAVMAAMESAEQRGYVRLINGRLCWFLPDERAHDLHKAFNRFVQASLAELGTEWMLYVEDSHPGILVNWVHDACYLEVPHGEEWRVEDIAKEGARLFEAMFDVVGGTDITLESEGARL
jgi:hypothetical protein